MAAAFPVGSAAAFAYARIIMRLTARGSSKHSTGHGPFRIEPNFPVARTFSYQPVPTKAVARSKANFAGLSRTSSSASSWRARETRLFIVPTAIPQIAAASS
jgi:hypothetical protein